MKTEQNSSNRARGSWSEVETFWLDPALLSDIVLIQYCHSCIWSDIAYRMIEPIIDNAHVAYKTSARRNVMLYKDKK